MPAAGRSLLPAQRALTLRALPGTEGTAIGCSPILRGIWPGWAVPNTQTRPEGSAALLTAEGPGPGEKEMSASAW